LAESWRVEGDVEPVCEWIGTETNPVLVGIVLDWIPEWAEDPEIGIWMPVPNEARQVFVTIVPFTTIGVKFLVSQEHRVLTILKVTSIDDL
jgi:hypothetical protein